MLIILLVAPSSVTSSASLRSVFYTLAFEPFLLPCRLWLLIEFREILKLYLDLLWKLEDLSQLQDEIIDVLGLLLPNPNLNLLLLLGS